MDLFAKYQKSKTRNQIDSNSPLFSSAITTTALNQIEHSPLKDQNNPYFPLLFYFPWQSGPGWKAKTHCKRIKKINHNPSFLLAFPLLGNLIPLRFEAFESEAKTHLSPSSSLIFSPGAIGSHRKRTKLTLFPPSHSSSLTLSGLSRLRRYSLKSKWTQKDQNNSMDRIEVNSSLPPIYRFPGNQKYSLK